jgi:DNA-binding MarR family transcriptional regulator
MMAAAPDDLGTATVTLDLDRSVPVLLNFLANRVTASGSAVYRARFGLGITEYRLLAMLAASPDITGRRIHEVMGLDTGAISKSLRALEARGLVRPRADDQNPAYRRWTLTQAGAALQDEATRIAIERDRLLLADISDEERAVLIDLLRRMLGNVPHLVALATEPG